MKFITSSIPADSIIHLWLKAASITEVPPAYAVATALSSVGCCLKRNVWCDQVAWKVYPNLSVLLIGPSGIGKDIAINAARKIITAIDEPLDIGGKTMETIVDQLCGLGGPSSPSCGFIAAPEITAFLGGKDYQKSMVQELTDLLSTGDSVNISTKSQGKRIIYQPTVTMMAGSTEEWLHQAMPAGSLEGGLFPRFLIICEEYNTKHVPWIKYSIDKSQREEAISAKEQFISETIAIIDRFRKGTEITPTRDAIDCYENWYINRFKYFSPAVRPYANRSRDQVLRLAMLSAVLRKKAYMDAEDITFATHIIAYVASTIERAALPPSNDAKVAKAILSILPATTTQIIRYLSKKFDQRAIHSGIQLLILSDEVEIEPRSKLMVRKDVPEE